MKTSTKMATFVKRIAVLSMLLLVLANNSKAQILALRAGTLKYTYTNTVGCTSSRTISGSGYSCAARGVSLNTDAITINNDFIMHPNPATSIINSQVETLIGRADIAATDLLCKQVKTPSIGIGNNTIDISGSNKGFYIVSMITVNRKLTKMLVAR